MIFLIFWDEILLLYYGLTSSSGSSHVHLPSMGTTGVPQHSCLTPQDSTGSIAAKLHFRERKTPEKVRCKSHWKHYFFADFLLMQSHCIALGWAGTCQCRPAWPQTCVDSSSLHHVCWNYRCEAPCPEDGINLCSNKWITIVKVAGSMKENTIKYGKPSVPQTHLLHGYEQNYLNYLKKTHHIN